MNFIPATENDIDFIIEAIFSAVKSGSDTLSYSTIFEVDETKLKTLFCQMLEEDVEGQELWLSGFLIAKDDNGQHAATCCAWVEGEEGPSSMLTAQLLSYYLGTENYVKAVQKQDIIESLRVDREEGALQIEHVYTSPQYRGQGLVAQVIGQQVKNYKENYPELKKVQIILFKQNENALNAYSKMGFEIAKEITSQNPEILNYFPANTRVLMEAPVERF